MSPEARAALNALSIPALVSLVQHVSGGSVEEHVIRSQIHRLREETGPNRPTLTLVA